MNNSTIPSNGTALTGRSHSTPAPLQLLDAFREAVEASQIEPDLPREALSLELLVIAGMASVGALSRLESFVEGLEREDGASLRLDRTLVRLASDDWFRSATTLRQRMGLLEGKRYESTSFAELIGAMIQVEENGAGRRAREALEGRALRTIRLAALAESVKPRQDVYDEDVS